MSSREARILQEPPPRKLPDGSDGPLYDSLTDDIDRPSIIVSCHRDYQAYCEYVICFTSEAEQQRRAVTRQRAASRGLAPGGRQPQSDLPDTHLLTGQAIPVVVNEYQVVRQVTVRTGARISSPAVGHLEVGQSVPALRRAQETTSIDQC